MISTSEISRRQVLAGFAAAAATGKAYGGSRQITLGFLYNGPKNDLGYNQSHAEGRLTLRSLAFAKSIEEASVPETVAAEESMRDMIFQDDASVIFATSFGYYDPFVVEMARENPRVQFFHFGGFYEEGKHPKNIGIYFGFIDEVEYLSGMLAGLATRSNKIGFVAAKPIPQVLRNINSFTLGARSVNPKVMTKVVFTGDWVLPVREAEASSSLVDQGFDVLTGHRLATRDRADGRETRCFRLRLSVQPVVDGAARIPDRRRMGLGYGVSANCGAGSRGEVGHGRQHPAPADRNAQRRVLQAFAFRAFGDGRVAFAGSGRKGCDSQRIARNLSGTHAG